MPDILGIGPRLFLITALLSAPLIVLRIMGVGDAWLAEFIAPWLPPMALRIAGGALLAIGLPWQLYAAGHLVRARAAQRLCIDGPYALCRHPLYAGWILLVVPGALLAATGDPFLLGIPPIMALVFRRLIAREEDQLAARFGAPYRAWQARTPLLMPRPGGRPGPPHHQGTTGSGPGAAG